MSLRCQEYIFREDFSGTRLDRPELTKLRLLVQQRHIAAVIVFSSDRLTRNPVDGDMLRRELRQYGVELHYTTRGEDRLPGDLSSSAVSKTNLMPTGAINYLRPPNEETGKGRIWHYPGPRPGYVWLSRRSAVNVRLVLKLSPEEAEVVRNIFTWYTIERSWRAGSGRPPEYPRLALQHKRKTTKVD
ncbi:MAG: recombinase family protein [Kouleothrix sp.]